MRRAEHVSGHCVTEKLGSWTHKPTHAPAADLHRVGARGASSVNEPVTKQRPGVTTASTFTCTSDFSVLRSPLVDSMCNVPCEHGPSDEISLRSLKSVQQPIPQQKGWTEKIEKRTPLPVRGGSDDFCSRFICWSLFMASGLPRDREVYFSELEGGG